MDQVAAINGKVEVLAEESGRAMRLVLGESDKFATKAATSFTEMDAKAESFRAAGAGIEARLSKGLMKIKSAQATAVAANMIQAASTRDNFAKMLEHNPNMRSLNEQNIARISAKLEEIEATRAAAAAVDPLQQGDAWQGQRLGPANTASADRAPMSRPPRFSVMGGPEGAEARYDTKKIGLCNAKDLEVSRLQEAGNRKQFILWRDGLVEHLENSPGWNRSTKVLETARSWAFEATTREISGNESLVGVVDVRGGLRALDDEAQHDDEQPLQGR